MMTCPLETGSFPACCVELVSIVPTLIGSLGPRSTSCILARLASGFAMAAPFPAQMHRIYNRHQMAHRTRVRVCALTSVSPDCVRDMSVSQ